MLLGFNAKLYRATGARSTWGAKVNGAATGAAPTLDEVANVKDVTVPIEKVQADVTTRKAGGDKVTKGTLRDVSIEFDMVNDPLDADLDAIQTAFLTDVTIPLAFLDGDKATPGTEGLWADFEVVKFERGEELENAQMIKIGVKPGWSNVAPEWVRVGA